MWTTITAAAILKLAEDRKLALDDPAFELIPNVTPPKGARLADPRVLEITVRELLNQMHAQVARTSRWPEVNYWSRYPARGGVAHQPAATPSK